MGETKVCIQENLKGGKKEVRKSRRLERIVLNISGEIYETTNKTLERFPQTLLGSRRKRLNYYCETSREYFFPRNKIFFDAILFFYQSCGLLQCPPLIDIELFEEECRFFEIPEYAIYKLKPLSVLSTILGIKEEELKKHTVVENPTMKMKLWDVLQHPETSTGAKSFALFSFFMIALSVASSCLETLPSLKVESTAISENPWEIIELLLNSWFLLELVAGAIFTPNIMDFLKTTMTWVDAIAVLPYFIVLIISQNDVSSIGFLKIVRLIRVARLFRLSKQSVRLKIFVTVISSSIQEFVTITLCLVIVVILGGAIIYHLENGSNVDFSNIPIGMYWSIQSITTVGYGDIVPQSVPGMIFGAGFVIFGALTLSIPVLCIVSKLKAVHEAGISGINSVADM